MSDSVCRWGFLSAANISRKNWKGIKLAGNGVVRAVASRSKAAASDFIAECQAEVPFAETPDAVEGYADLIARDDVDAIYIPLPTATRKEWVIKAAEAGKHVLCEKPCAVTATDLREMIAACNAAGVQFMDGVMYVHSRRMELLRSVLDEPKNIGQLRRITSHFTFCGDEEFRRSNIRVNSRLEPHGCLGDLGWYTIRLALFVMRYELPRSVRARILTPLQGADSPGPVPGEFSAELDFEEGVTACFYNSFLTENCQEAILAGDRGFITLNDFVLPFLGAELDLRVHQHDVAIDNCRWNIGRHTQRHAVREYAGGEPGSQEVRMMQRFGQIVLSGRLEEHWPEIALKTQLVLDACRRSADADGAATEIEPY